LKPLHVHRRLWFLASLLLMSVAEAEPDRAAAEELFLRGKAAMASQDYVKASRFFEDSYKLDSGLGTLLNLALCHKEIGRVASAWSEFKQLEGVALRSSPPQLDRVKIAREQSEALYPRLSRIKILVLPSVRVAGIEIAVDGKKQAESLWEIGVPVDPGTHTVTADAPGKKSFESSVKIDDEKLIKTVQVLTLMDGPPALKKTELPPTGTSLIDAERAASIRAQRTAGYVVGGGGVLLLSAGSVFGILAAGQASEASKCSSNEPCFASSDKLGPARSAYDRGSAYANVSNVLVPLGIVAAGVGLYLVLSAKPAAALGAKSGQPLWSVSF
jgi:hypothetical protein